MSRGHDRERAVRNELEIQGFWVGRICGSLGDVDLVALRRQPRPKRFAAIARITERGGTKLPLLSARRTRLVIEVKSTAGGPYERFGPTERRELLEAAKLADADAVLAYCPPGRRSWRWIWPSEWPT